MNNTNTNPDYAILDKILREADLAERNGKRTGPSPQGVELTPAQLEAIANGVDDIEKYLRS